MHMFGRPSPSPLSNETKAVPYVDTTALSRGESPPLTSSLHSRNSAKSAQESAYLRQAVVLKWFRLLFAIFMASISIAVTAILSHLLRNYNNTVLPGEWNLALWPLNVDVRPTLALLIPAALTVAGSLLYITFAIVPSPHSRYLVQNYIFAFVSIGGAIATLVGVAFNSYIEAHVVSMRRDSISSWTCGLYDGAKNFVADTNALELSTVIDPLVPEGFQLACMETQVAKWMTVGLLVIQVICLCLAAAGLNAEKRMSRIRRSRYPEEKSSFT